MLHCDGTIHFGIFQKFRPGVIKWRSSSNKNFSNFFSFGIYNRLECVFMNAISNCSSFKIWTHFKLRELRIRNTLSSVYVARCVWICIICAFFPNCSLSLFNHAQKVVKFLPTFKHIIIACCALVGCFFLCVYF